MMRGLRHGIYTLALAAARVWPHAKKRSFRLTILKLDRLGDAVLSLGAVRILLREFGADQTLLIVSTVAEPLYRAEFPKVELLVLPPFCDRYFPDLLAFLWRHAASLRTRSTDTLVCLRHQPSDYLHVIAQLIAPKKCYATAWDKDWENVSLTFPNAQRVAYPQVSAGQCQELEAHRRLIELVLGREIAMAQALPVISCMTPAVGSTLLVCPVAGAAIRQYPPRLLAVVLGEFLKTTQRQVAFCLPPEADPVPWQEAMSAAGLAINGWHQPQTLRELVQVIAAAQVVLAVESAPAHLATALDRPGVFLLGGGHYGMFAPWQTSSRQIWLQHAMDCYQCRWNCRHPEPYCITHIQPSAIAQALSQACGNSIQPA